MKSLFLNTPTAIQHDQKTKKNTTNISHLLGVAGLYCSGPYFLVFYTEQTEPINV